MRVSTPGVDVAAAEFNNLIFDGNQQPLRLWGTGFVVVYVIDYDNSMTINHTIGPLVLPTPAGTSPPFVVTVKRESTGTNQVSPPGTRQVSVSACGGGAVSNVDGGGNKFVGITVAREVIRTSNTSPGPGTGSVWVNYAIFKNYQ